MYYPSEAYMQGFRAGQADRRQYDRATSSYEEFTLDPDYLVDYKRGYRDGWNVRETI